MRFVRLAISLLHQEKDQKSRRFLQGHIAQPSTYDARLLSSPLLEFGYAYLPLLYT